MTLEALLTFFGILVAVLAVVRPVQRRSLQLFAPLRLLYLSIAASVVLIVWRDAPFGVAPPFGWRLEIVLFVLTIAAFLLPVGSALYCWASWNRARLTSWRIGRVEHVFQAALREHEFDEVERILQRNHAQFERFPRDAAAVLFSPRMVSALLESHSPIHLELLSNLRFLTSLEDRHGAVEAVTRELLTSEVSPLRSAVMHSYGGMDSHPYSDKESDLIEKTFQNPDWYYQANAHYPLDMAALEAVRSGRFDAVYNDIGRHYEASQGISTRSRCPIFLATKTHVLAIIAALNQRMEKDFYVTDLLDVFRAVLERSKFTVDIWNSSLANTEHPTPYSYLLHEITWDLRCLSETALDKATDRSTSQVSAPGQLAAALALTWSFCIWCIARSAGQVSPEFRRDVIQEYLLFILALGFGPSEAYHGPISNVAGLTAWRDLFLSELQARFVGEKNTELKALKSAFESLDMGKHYVFEGRDWLHDELFG